MLPISRLFVGHYTVVWFPYKDDVWMIMKVCVQRNSDPRLRRNLVNGKLSSVAHRSNSVRLISRPALNPLSYRGSWDLYEDVCCVLTVPPDITASPDTEVPEGDTLILYCNVTGQPQPSVTWYKDGISKFNLRYLKDM